MVYMKTRRFSSECLCCVEWQNVSLYKIDVGARVNNGHRTSSGGEQEYTYLNNYIRQQKRACKYLWCCVF